MVNDYIQVIRDDVCRLLHKKGRPSSDEYFLLLKRIDTLKEFLSK